MRRALGLFGFFTFGVCAFVLFSSLAGFNAVEELPWIRWLFGVFILVLILTQARQTETYSDFVRSENTQAVRNILKTFYNLCFIVALLPFVVGFGTAIFSPDSIPDGLGRVTRLSGDYAIAYQTNTETVYIRVEDTTDATLNRVTLDNTPAKIRDHIDYNTYREITVDEYKQATLFGWRFTALFVIVFSLDFAMTHWFGNHYKVLGRESWNRNDDSD